jgi:hypothetical protein
MVVNKVDGKRWWGSCSRPDPLRVRSVYEPDRKHPKIIRGGWPQMENTAGINEDIWQRKTRVIAELSACANFAVGIA